MSLDADIDGGPSQKRIKTREINIDAALPPNIAAQLSSLASLHPDLTRLTIKKRAHGWGVYAPHSGILKALDGKSRKANQLYDNISNYLKQSQQ